MLCLSEMMQKEGKYFTHETFDIKLKVKFECEHDRVIGLVFKLLARNANDGSVEKVNN